MRLNGLSGDMEGLLRCKMDWMQSVNTASIQLQNTEKVDVRWASIYMFKEELFRTNERQKMHHLLRMQPGLAQNNRPHDLVDTRVSRAQSHIDAE